MGLFVILGFQLVFTAIGFALMWRRLGALGKEVADLRRVVEARGARPARAAVATIGGASVLVPTDNPPMARAARAWRMTRAPKTDVALSSETGRGLALAVVATAPAIGFFLKVDASAIVAVGLVCGAAMMLAALKPAWRAGAWAGVLTTSAWALVGFALGAAHAGPIWYAAPVGLAGASGLLFAHLRHAQPGAVMALAMSAAVIALGSQTGLIGPAGVVFGALVALASIVGAANLRLEAIHLAAFGATLIGLFVLSGQSAAAIWFTPVTSWAGALFLGIAAIRVPQLGARGVALAGTGALAPLACIAALYGAQHGLSDRVAAGGAFFALALVLAGVLALAALRRARGLLALKLTLWVLALGALAALIAGVALALPAPAAAPVLMALATGLVWQLDARWPHAAWRSLACMTAAIAALDAWISAAFLLTEAPGWAPWTLIALGLGLPAVFASAAAVAVQRDPAARVYLASLAMVLGMAAANLATRVLFSDGATLLQPVSFLEAGVHISVWLVGALVIGAGAKAGTHMRSGAAAALGFAALAASVGASALRLTSYWSARANGDVSPQDVLGFALPALLFGAHWVFWRARGSNLRTRLSLAGGALMAAAALTLGVLEARAADGLGALVGAAAFALAIIVNFAPGVTNTHAPQRQAYVDDSLSRRKRRPRRVEAR
jgi:hypothetical protein